MTKVDIRLVVRDYDHVAPLACGDITAEGIHLHLDRKTSMLRFVSDPSFQAGEMSFSQYLIRLSRGDRSFVGLPVFVMRVFRHRGFYVVRDSGMQSLQALEGKRVGTNGWADTGNTWARAAIREQGLGIDQIDWVVGPVDDPSYDSFGHRPQLRLPDNVAPCAPGRTLREMLLKGELDALMCPWPPAGFYDPGCPIVRLIANYRRVEQEYARRVGYYPAHHIVAVRREVFDRDPWIASSLYQALERSRIQSQRNRRSLADTTPWLLADIEETSELLGDDWQPNGVGPNQKMIQALCDEELEQGLIESPLDSAQVFEEFEAASSGLS